MILKIDEVIKRFNGTLALDSFNLEVAQGEVVGLLGPNGAGKTTCIRSVIGLIPVDEGSITVFGLKQNGKDRTIKRRIGYVTQELTVYEEMTAKENMAFFGRLYGLDKATLAANIAETAKLIGLETRLNEKVKRYSGGMKRRLNIGCSLLHNPELIIMDEATASIDPQTEAKIQRSMQTVFSDKTALVVAHRLTSVLDADEILFYQDGEIIHRGTHHELMEVSAEYRKLVELQLLQTAVNDG